MNDSPSSLSAVRRNLEELTRKVDDLKSAASAKATRKAYASDWRDFESFCGRFDLSALPSTPQTVALYLADCVDRELAWATIIRRLTSITHFHRNAGYEDSPASAHHEIVKKVANGIRRTLGVAQKCKTPLVTTDIQKIIRACPDGMVGYRDRALLLIGYAGAFRRSELAAIDVRDLAFCDQGVTITVPRSKTDQVQAGRDVHICNGDHPETCPVSALKAWLTAASITENKVFRSVNRYGHASSKGLNPASVQFIIQQAAIRAGMDATNLAGHSLRAGMVTQAAKNGLKERKIAEQTGHKSMSVLQKYIRMSQKHRESPSASLGL